VGGRPRSGLLVGPLRPRPRRARPPRSGAASPRPCTRVEAPKRTSGSFEERRGVDDAVLAQVAEVCRRYGAGVVTDQFAAPAVVERLRRAGLVVRTTPMTASPKTAAFGELRARLNTGSLVVVRGAQPARSYEGCGPATRPEARVSSTRGSEARTAISRRRSRSRAMRSRTSVWGRRTGRTSTGTTRPPQDSSASGHPPTDRSSEPQYFRADRRVIPTDASRARRFRLDASRASTPRISLIRVGT
jgi:hypothetical protein